MMNTPPTWDPSGKVTLVTGAARGIGKEVVRVLRECGAKIVAVDLFNEVKAWAAENVATF